MKWEVLDGEEAGSNLEEGSRGPRTSEVGSVCPGPEPAALLQASCLRPLHAALITAGRAPGAQRQVRAQVSRLQAIGDLAWLCIRKELRFDLSPTQLNRIQ